MSKPTLLIAASTYPRWSGDTEPGFVHELARRLVVSFDVVVSCPHAPGAARSELMDGVLVQRYRYAPTRFESLAGDGGITANLKGAPWKWMLLPPFLMAQMFAFIKLCWRHRPAVVHAHWLIPQGLIGALAAYFAPAAPLLVTSHGGDLYALRARPLVALKRWVVSRSKAVTVVSTPMLVELKRIGADTRKVTVLPMGINLGTRFVPDATVARSDGEVLFVGRLVEKKGLKHLLAAFPEILRRCPHAHLTVVGSGPGAKPAQQQVQALGLGERVRFLGAVPQMQLPALYQRAAVFVAPFVRSTSGDQEGLGLVVGEALGCGCPVVVGNVESMRDFGLEPVDAERADALSTAVAAVLTADPAIKLHQQREQREKCLSWLDWDQIAMRYRDRLLACMERAQ